MSAGDIARGAPRPKAVLSDELKARIAERVKTWGVRAERAVATETSALVFGTRDGKPVVVKVARWPGDEWRGGEIAAAFGGRGVVQVHDHVAGAALLERLVPGTPLVTLVLEGRDEEATEILAALLRRMSPGDPPAGCPTVEQWGLGFERYLATNDAQIPRELVLHAHHVYFELAAAQREPALLHGDLQHYNVLHDERRGWVAIDPKGVVGELEYEIGAALRNPFERPDLFASPEAIERRLGIFYAALGIDVDRARAWAFAQAVLSAIWSVEGGYLVDEKNAALRVARAIEQSSAFRSDFGA
ncbi:MAG TPA: aminoglycoside phosphotransferase family protein [Gammaproteobacteria bacterium]|nr:aminoglycoside phosphotransferase family protein [Gammaproteobacteria bacterium]